MQTSHMFGKTSSSREAPRQQSSYRRVHVYSKTGHPSRTGQYCSGVDFFTKTYSKLIIIEKFH